MSYNLSRTEDNAKVKKAVGEAQGVYDVHGKREWVEWVGKTLMPWLHAQMAMEQADTMRAEQDVINEEQSQAERAEREQERAAKEAQLEAREDKYIKQLDANEIDEARFRELIGELDLERAMGESVVEGPATTQDEEVGESEREELAEEEPAEAEKGVELSTVGKGKRKVAPARAKVYTEVDGPVSILTSRRQYTLTHLLTVQPMSDVEVEASLHHKPTREEVQEMSDQQEQVLLEGAES
jgi:hypothetical protein